VCSTSALKQYLENIEHTFNYKKTKMLSKERYYNNLKIYEILRIKQNSKAVTKLSEIEIMYLTYNHLIKTKEIYINKNTTYNKIIDIPAEKNNYTTNQSKCHISIIPQINRNVINI